jgi:ribosome-associated protein
MTNDLAEFIKVDLKKNGIRPLSVEGIKDGRWVLLDYGDVIIHVFYEPLRGFYDLEGLWTDAKRVTTDDKE